MGERGRGLIACLPSGTYRLGPGIAMAISSRPTGQLVPIATYYAY
jgi:hypothetical protein